MDSIFCIKELSELFYVVLKYLPYREVVKLKRLTKTTNALIKDKICWRVLAWEHFKIDVLKEDSSEEKYLFLCKGYLENGDRFWGAWDPSVGGLWQRHYKPNVGWCYTLEKGNTWISVNSEVLNPKKGKYKVYWLMQNDFNLTDEIEFKFFTRNKGKSWEEQSAKGVVLPNILKKYGAPCWIKVPGELVSTKDVMCCELKNTNCFIHGGAWKIIECAFIPIISHKIWEKINCKGKGVDLKKDFTLLFESEETKKRRLGRKTSGKYRNCE